MPIKNIKLKRIRTRNIVMFTVVVFILAAIYTAVHYYIYRRLTWGFAFESANMRRLLGLSLFLLANTYFAARLMARLKITPTAVAFDWIDRLVGDGVLFVLCRAGRSHCAVRASRMGNDIDRFRHLYGIAVIALAIATCGYAHYRAAYTIDVTRIEAGVKNLPPHLEGFRIVQVSDLHLGVIVNRRRAAIMVDRINELNPDLVVMTGDVVDEAPGMLNGIIGEFKRITAKHGILASVGNHEYFHGVDEVVRSAEKAGIRFIPQHESRRSRRIVVYGVDDPVGARMGGKLVRISDVVDAEAKERPAILMYHRPANFRHGVVAGHRPDAQRPTRTTDRCGRSNTSS